MWKRRIKGEREPPKVRLAPLGPLTQPPPKFAATLADIFSSLQDSDPTTASEGLRLVSTEQEEQDVVPPQLPELLRSLESPWKASLVSRRPLAFEVSGEKSIKQSKAMAMRFPAASKRVANKFAGELRSSDFRSYGTLDQLLSPGFQISEPPRPGDGTAPGLDSEPVSMLALDNRPTSEFMLAKPGIEAHSNQTSISRIKFSGSGAQSSHLPRSSCCSQSASSSDSSESDSGSDWTKDTKDSGQKTVRPLTNPTKLRPARPQSPLRPGVYHGSDAPYHVKMTPKCLPEPAKWRGIGQTVRPATSDAVSLVKAPVRGSRRLYGDQEGSCGLSQWETIVQKIEDEGRSDDSKHYEDWRRRVVECSRTLQDEVARFKMDEK